MITPLSLLERAKQGDAGAIAALMNDVLQPQEVWVKATLDADCLQVMLKSPAVLSQNTCITFIRRGLLHLQPEAITQVRAYAWRVGDAFPLWIATFALKQPLSDDQSISISEPSLHGMDAGAHFTDHLSVSLQQPVQALTPLPATSKQRSELFKLGFVIVLVTMVYFAVTGV